jgi:hypothetical protein
MKNSFLISNQLPLEQVIDVNQLQYQNPVIWTGNETMNRYGLYVCIPNKDDSKYFCNENRYVSYFIFKNRPSVKGTLTELHLFFRFSQFYYWRLLLKTSITIMGRGQISPYYMVISYAQIYFQTFYKELQNLSLRDWPLLVLVVFTAQYHPIR